MTKTIRRTATLLLMTLFILPALADETDDFMQMLKQFEQSSKSGKVKQANQIFTLLDQQEMLDTPITVDRKTPLDSIMMKVYYHGGDYLCALQQFGDAINYAERALPLCQGNDGYEGDCYNLLAVCYTRLTLYSQGIEAAEKSLKSFERTNDRGAQASVLNTLAGLYLMSKRPQEGEKYALRGIKLREEGAEPQRISINYGIASEIYHAMKQDDKALEYAQKAYDADMQNGDEARAAMRLCVKAEAEAGLQRMKEAKQTLERAIPMLKKSGNKHSLAICYNQMGELLNTSGRQAEAVNYLQQAREILSSQGDRYGEARSYHGLHEALKQSNPAEAARYLSSYADLKDSIYQDNIERMLSNFDSFYKNEQLAQDNDMLKRERRNFTWTVLGVLFVIFITIASLIYALYQRIHSNKIIQNNSEARERFYTNVTHEFRTPLTVILGKSEELEKQPAQSPEQVNEAGRMIGKQGQSMLNLVNQLLDISKVHSEIGEADWRTGNVIPWLYMVVEECEQLAQSKSIRLQYLPMQEEVEMDIVPDYLHKIIINLVNNAIKFTPIGGEVEVHCQQLSSKLQIRVQDTGIGIEPEHLGMIFDPFYREERDKQTVGSGIGLALVHRLVEAMQGTIHVESTVGKGTTFTLLFNLKHGKGNWMPLTWNGEYDSMLTQPISIEEKQQPIDTQENEESQARLLIVEDNADVAKLIGDLLAHNYQICYASSGEEGLQQLSNKKPDLVITDVMMPGIDGLEVCRRIRQNVNTRTIPVIILTAKTTQEDLEEGLRAGADAYLFKPFSGEELRIRVEWLLAERRMMREKFQLSSMQMKEAKQALKLDDKQFLTDFTNIIYEQMRQTSIDTDLIAERLCISRRTLQRRINAITGSTISNYITKIRIDYARQLLKEHPNMPISEVGMRCGYVDAAYFSRTFSRLMGLSPAQYRKA